jgi:hypothetical protein
MLNTSKTLLMGFHDTSSLDFYEWLAACYAALIKMHTPKDIDSLPREEQHPH